MEFLDETRIPNLPYPELREVLDTFVNEISKELGQNIIGIYMVGSLATGDFDLDSDVDFLVITKTELVESNIKALEAIQKNIQQMGCYPAKHLEGSFISIEDVNNWQTVGKKELYYFDNGSTDMEKSTHDNKWHVRWIIRERGITLIGQRPEQIVQAVPIGEVESEIRAAMIEAMKGFKDEIDQPRSFWNSKFGQSFAVLTFCRMMHTLKSGTIQSKKAGAEWAKQFVEPKWVNIIDQAWAEREGVRFLVKIRQRADQELLNETLEFMKYAIMVSEDNQV
jgi:predicted nucleotidyltransferase